MTEGSEIVEFYKDKNILLTGATGFLGKLFIDQLLRKCEPKALYLVIRPKKDVEPEKRLTSLFQCEVFDKLKREKPNFLERIELIEGDMGKPNLGIDDQSVALITEKIEIVFHGAATVKFDEHIKLATEINVLGTKNMVFLCKKIKNLQSFIYVSTAFANCPRLEIGEEFYDVPISADNLIKLVECLNNDKLSLITNQILDIWPNSYSFTKAIAESAVNKYAHGLPVSVFRPAIVTSTRNEPIDGWIDNLYGPIGYMVGVGSGLIRVCLCSKDGIASIVPGDMTVQAAIAAGYKTSIMGPTTNDIPIYNYVPREPNFVTWNDFLQNCLSAGKKIPSAKAIWYLSLTICSNIYLFKFLILLLHLLPALLVDIVLIITKGKPQALKIYGKIHKFSDVISYFSLRTWKFHSNNVQALWSGLNNKDRELFNFDMKNLDWNTYLKSVTMGVRIYLIKDPLDSLTYAKQKNVWLYILHRLVQLAFFSAVGFLLWSAVKLSSRILL